jgi:hypothetical protein
MARIINSWKLRMLTFSPRMIANSWIEAETPRCIYYILQFLSHRQTRRELAATSGFHDAGWWKNYYMVWAELIPWSYVLIVCGSRGIHRKVNYDRIRYVELCREANTIDKLEMKTKLQVHEKLRARSPVNPSLRNSYCKTASLTDQSTNSATDAFYKWLKYHRIAY